MRRFVCIACIILLSILIPSDNKAAVGEEEFKLYSPVVQVHNPYVATHWHVAWFGWRYAYGDYHYLAEKYTRAYPFSQERDHWQDKTFIPAVKCDQLGDWMENYGDVTDVYTGEVFVLNEPLLWGQGCHLNAQEAYDFVVQFREICPNCYIIAPNMSQLNGYKVFMRDFMGKNPPIDAISYHYYGFMNYPDPVDQLSFYVEFGYPIYITEWGVKNPDQATKLLKMWSNEPLVVETYYFAPHIPCDYTGDDSWPCETSLFDADGNITPIGQAIYFP